VILEGDPSTAVIFIQQKISTGILTPEFASQKQFNFGLDGPILIK
jgi:hypothetical protein